MYVDWLILVEIGAVASGLLSVYFAVREDNRTWSIGIVNVMLVATMFWADRLYVSVLLQGIYVIYNLYSWQVWLRGGAGRQPPAIARTPRAAWLPLVLAAAAFTAGFGWVFAQTENPRPVEDALAVALSLVAQWMLTKKWLENWWVWVGANVFYIYLNLAIAERNYLYAALQVVYIALSVIGYVNWTREMRRGDISPPAAARPPRGEGVTHGEAG